MQRQALVGVLGLLLCACPKPGTGNDGGSPADAAGPALDASVADASIHDAAVVDAASGDAGPGRPSVVINEFMALNNTNLADEAGQHEDWVELLNTGSMPANVNGLYLSDDAVAPQKSQLSGLDPIPAGGFLVLFADGDTIAGPRHLGFKLSGNGETIMVTAADGTLLDRQDFGPQVVDVSMGRFPDGTGAFQSMTTATPGAPNSTEVRDAGPTPDASPQDASVPDAFVPPATGVFLNEFTSNNVGGLQDELGQAEDWIELINTGATAADISFHHLSDTVSAPSLWAFPSGTTIAAGGFLIVFADASPEQGPLHAGFKLASTGEAVVFSAPDGTILDSHVFGAQAVDTSAGRVPDGTGAWMDLSTPSPGGSNAPATDAGSLPDATTTLDAG